jgi:hypothetical protein
LDSFSLPLASVPNYSSASPIIFYFDTATDFGGFGDFDPDCLDGSDFVDISCGAGRKFVDHMASCHPCSLDTPDPCFSTVSEGLCL